jgi:hypothetical protein
MVAVDSFEKLVNIYQTTRHHIPEDSNLLRERVSIEVKLDWAYLFREQPVSLKVGRGKVEEI